MSKKLTKEQKSIKNKKYYQRKKTKAIKYFILFIAQNCQIIQEGLPNYKLNCLVAKGDLKLIL